MLGMKSVVAKAATTAAKLPMPLQFKLHTSSILRWWRSHVVGKGCTLWPVVIWFVVIMRLQKQLITCT